MRTRARAHTHISCMHLGFSISFLLGGLGLRGLLFLRTRDLGLLLCVALRLRVGEGPVGGRLVRDGSFGLLLVRCRPYGRLRTVRVRVAGAGAGAYIN